MTATTNIGIFLRHQITRSSFGRTVPSAENPLDTATTRVTLGVTSKHFIRTGTATTPPRDLLFLLLLPFRTNLMFTLPGTVDGLAIFLVGRRSTGGFVAARPGTVLTTVPLTVLHFSAVFAFPGRTAGLAKNALFVFLRPLTLHTHNPVHRLLTGLINIIGGHGTRIVLYGTTVVVRARC